MEDKEVKLRITLMIDGKWASHQSDEELTDYIRERLNSSLGFRGQIKRFKLLRKAE